MSLPYLIVPSPCTIRISPVVATIFHATLCWERRRLIRSMPRPISGPAMTTETTRDTTQLMLLA